MDGLKPVLELLREWLPFLITLLIGTLVLMGAYRILISGRAAKGTGNIVGRQLLIALLAGIVAVVLILELPIDNEPRGQLMSLLGILVTAAVALSSTTLLGNAMAGFMLRSIRNFHAGDFIVVDGHRGRVSELGLLRTEIQTERRTLTTFPNLYLVSNPVTVVRESGTFIAASVSLGYDVPREKIEKCLLDAAEHAGLTDPFVFVLELGDFSITYQAAGFLEEVKFLISAESKLRANMLDALHQAGIEIVSPTFMNQRQLKPEKIFIPEGSRAPKPKVAPAEEPRPEDRMFDKAELAEAAADAEVKLKAVVDEIGQLQKDRAALEKSPALASQLATLETTRTQLEEEVQQHKEAKEKEAEADKPESKS
ncbi:MAG: mechanosensitive ion channel [Myxococcales bacterium]|nr:mechanosensitive ion channel [Myxococcales bacterium]RZV50074.1 MAG: mechanosensitive ion channel [Deltaproteobacteria bacterium]